MGDAKRRRQLIGDRYGQPIPYELSVFANGEPAFEMTIGIKRRATDYDTHLVAIAQTQRIAAFLQSPSKERSQLLFDCLPDQAAIDWLRVVRDEIGCDFYIAIAGPDGPLTTSDGHVVKIASTWAAVPEKERQQAIEIPLSASSHLLNL